MRRSDLISIIGTLSDGVNGVGWRTLSCYSLGSVWQCACLFLGLPLLPPDLRPIYGRDAAATLRVPVAPARTEPPCCLDCAQVSSYLTFRIEEANLTPSKPQEMKIAVFSHMAVHCLESRRAQDFRHPASLPSNPRSMNSLGRCNAISSALTTF